MIPTGVNAQNESETFTHTLDLLFLGRPCSDRSGIQDLNSVEALQDKLIRALRNVVMQNHGEESATTFTKLLLKLPELRSLNNMHSEELLSFKVHP